MSYDLMIFEKNKIPTNRSDFLNWYNQKMECDDERDIFSVSEKMQKAFHSLRNIFLPVNGLHVADNKSLSENPEIEKYLCHYFIAEDMIYLSFSYSISKFAYDTVKRVAYFLDMGFFNPNEDSLPVVFDSRCPMFLEGNGSSPGK